MTPAGFVHIYTGNGKGKTTASLGLALRAVGAGKKVFIGQFVKQGDYSELVAIRKFLPDITIRQFGLDSFIIGEPTQDDYKVAHDGLSEIKTVMASGEYDLVILDEINIALYFKLFTMREVVDLIGARPTKVEVVLTGRNAPKELIEIADLVTEMKEVKHYFSTGTQAREGIEF